MDQYIRPLADTVAPDFSRRNMHTATSVWRLRSPGRHAWRTRSVSVGLSSSPPRSLSALSVDLAETQERAQSCVPTQIDMLASPYTSVGRGIFLCSVISHTPTHRATFLPSSLISSVCPSACQYALEAQRVCPRRFRLVYSSRFVVISY